MSLGILDFKHNFSIWVKCVKVHSAEVLLDGKSHSISERLEILPGHKC